MRPHGPSCRPRLWRSSLRGAPVASPFAKAKARSLLCSFNSKRLELAQVLAQTVLHLLRRALSCPVSCLSCPVSPLLQLLPDVAESQSGAGIVHASSLCSSLHGWGLSWLSTRLAQLGRHHGILFLQSPKSEKSRTHGKGRPPGRGRSASSLQRPPAPGPANVGVWQLHSRLQAAAGLASWA